jgi:hypothetical protein
MKAGRIASIAARRSEWKAAIEASAAAATKQLEELSQRVAAEAAAGPGRDARLLQQAQDAAAAHVKQQVADAKAELLRDLEGWGEKVQAAAGEAAAERVKAAGEVRASLLFGGCSVGQKHAASGSNGGIMPQVVAGTGAQCMLVLGRRSQQLSLVILHSEACGLHAAKLPHHLGTKQHLKVDICAFCCVQAQMAAVNKQLSEALQQKQKQLEESAAAAASAAAAPVLDKATAAADKAAGSATAAAASAAAAEGHTNIAKEGATAAEASAKAAKAEATSMKVEVTAALEKKMHAALDASLVTLRKEAGSQAVAPLRKEFDELRDAIKRNAQWMLQSA